MLKVAAHGLVQNALYSILRQKCIGGRSSSLFFWIMPVTGAFRLAVYAVYYLRSLRFFTGFTLCENTNVARALFVKICIHTPSLALSMAVHVARIAGTGV